MANKKRALAADILVFLLIVAIVYSVAVFISWEPNPKRWGIFARMGCMIAIAYFLHIFIKTKTD